MKSDENLALVWMAEAQKCITAGRISKQQQKSLRHSNSIFTFHSMVTICGYLQEPRSQAKYIQEKFGLMIRTSKSEVSITHLWLAASPDGLVTDPRKRFAARTDKMQESIPFYKSDYYKSSER